MNYYHYTDAQAIHSILNTGCLWLTDLRFMNDANELTEGLRYLNEQLSGPQTSLWFSMDYLQQAINYLKVSISEFERNLHAEEPLFALSLSSSADLLSQWRGYGTYALAFDSEMLKDSGIQVTPCIYSSQKKRVQANRSVTTALEAISQQLQSSGGSLTSICIDQFLGLIDLAASFKDGGFREEGEMRVILRRGKNPIKYRARGSMLIPYIEVKVPLDVFSGVTIGPMQDADLARASMLMFAEDIEHRVRAPGTNPHFSLDVRMSRIPYRA